MNRTNGWIALLLFGGGTSALAQSARIENLGWRDVDLPVAGVQAVSADGRIAIGSDVSLIRWTDGNVESLGNFGSNTYGDDLSDDGAVVVGSSDNAGQGIFHAFRWQNGSFFDLGSLAGTTSWSQSFGCSADGAVIVGRTDVNATHKHAFRWQNGAMIDLGTIGNAAGNSDAFGCSPDGALIVGESWNGSRTRACRFSTPGAAVDLGTIGGADVNSRAYAVSPDGTFIVGYSYLTDGTFHAFDLSDQFGFYDLGTVDGVAGNSFANAVSTIGLVTVGYSANDGRSGGEAAVWFNAQPRQLWDLLENDYGLDLHGWTSLDTVSDVSDDGNTFVGTGHGFGSIAVPFRVTITPNAVPSVVPQGIANVESQGALTNVALTCVVHDADAGDRLIVDLYVDNALKATAVDVSPAVTTVSLSAAIGPGTHSYRFDVSDGKDLSGAGGTVTISDTTDPIVIVASDVVKSVDPGEIFATIALTPPNVTDAGDATPTITSDAPATFPIGLTKVLWTVTDDAGNSEKALQKVTVVNAAPKANAGIDLVRRTSKASVVVKLNGSKSRDANQHTLKYKWTAPGTKLTNSTTSKPTGAFKLGTTKVTLTVADEAGVKATDTMNVKVQKIRKARKRGANADSAVRKSYASGAKANGKGKANASSAAGLAFSVQAYGLGALAGDDLGAKGSPAAGEVGAYVALRSQQSVASGLAAKSFYDAYLTGGRHDAFEASLYAHAAGAYAQGDAAGSEYDDVLAVSVE